MTDFEENLVHTRLARLGIGVGPLGKLWWHQQVTPLPDEGWKIHLSARPDTLFETLDRAAPALRGRNFKVIRSRPLLEALNCAVYGRRAVGKAITLYPPSTPDFVVLIETLAGALRGLDGPPIAGELRCVACPVLHYRYAAHGKRRVVDRWGRCWSCVTAPDGRLVPDRADFYMAFPAWMTDPFEGRSEQVEEAENTSGATVLADLGLELVETLRRGRRHVARARDMRAPGRTYIVKWLHRPSAPQSAQEGLRRERDTAMRLYGRAPVPELVLSCEDAALMLLVFEDLGDDTLWDRAGNDPGQLPESVRRLIKAIGRVHASGFIVGDLSPWNAVWRDGDVYFVDLEHFAPMGLPAAWDWVTPGFDSVYQGGDWRRDIAALGRLIICLASGMRPDASDDALDRERGLWLLDGAPNAVRAVAVMAACGSRAKMPGSAPLLRLLTSSNEQAAVSPPHDVHGLVQAAIRELKREARQENARWPSAKRDARSFGVSLFDGDLGPAWFLLCAAANDEEAVMLAARGIDNALNEMDAGIGLYTGSAGTALTGAVCAHLLGDHSRMARALEMLQRTGRREASHLDLLSGVAGRMAAGLRVHELAPEAGLQRQVSRDALVLVEAWAGASEGGGGMTRGFCLPQKDGFGLGWLGIADALLSVHQRMPDQGIAACVTAIEQRAAATFWRLGEASARRPKPPRMASWCAGWAGFGLFQLHAFRLERSDERRARIETTLDMLAASRLESGGLCHGAAGVLHFALCATAEGFTRADALANRCAALLAGLHIRTAAGVTWRGDGRHPSASYMLGASGIAHLLASMSRGTSTLMPHELPTEGDACSTAANRETHAPLHRFYRPASE